MKTLKSVLIAGGIFALALNNASAAGFFTNGVPPAGGTQYPTTLPLTGNELIPADTQLPSGLNPQSEAISTAQLGTYALQVPGSSGVRNLLIGGDLTTNPWQRGTSFTSIANTLTYTADRWWDWGQVPRAFLFPSKLAQAISPRGTVRACDLVVPVPTLT